MSDKIADECQFCHSHVLLNRVRNKKVPKGVQVSDDIVCGDCGNLVYGRCYLVNNPEMGVIPEDKKGV